MTAPLAVTKADAIHLTRMPSVFRRWHHYGWIEVVRPGGRGRGTIIDYASLVEAYERFKKGEQPPLLPSELRAEARRNRPPP